MTFSGGERVLRRPSVECTVRWCVRGWWGCGAGRWVVLPRLPDALSGSPGSAPEPEWLWHRDAHKDEEMETESVSIALRS